MNTKRKPARPGGKITGVRKPRARGRPTEQDAGATREDILNTAENLFAQQGFAATSMREIAQGVGVTPAMIHYYFGTKKSLLRNVLDRTLLPLADAVAALRNSDRDPITGFTRLFIRMASEHPNLSILISREVILPGGQLQAHFLEHFAPRLGGALPGLLAIEQEKGKLRSNFDPRVAAILIISLCIFPFLAKSLSSKALGLSYDNQNVEQLAGHVEQLLQQGLRS